MYRVKEVVINE